MAKAAAKNAKEKGEKKNMRILITIALILPLKLTFSQSLSPEAVKVKISYKRLVAEPGNKQLQINYIEAFPPNTKTFLKVFNPGNFDQLYTDSWIYIDTFEKCAANFPKQVLSRCMDIGKSLVWDADAVGELQRISVHLALEHIDIFINKYETLTHNEQDSLISFYADVENFDAYPEYQNLINKLKSIHQIIISNKLEMARKKRKKSDDH